VQIVTPAERKHRYGIVTFTLGNTAANLALMEHLLDHKILVSVRYTAGVGGARVSIHLFNSAEDVDRILNMTEGYLRGR
jgi:cysteine desulfurase/selenocysteine lyase